MSQQTPAKIDLPFTFTERRSRTLIHQACGKTTEVSGVQWYDLSDPTKPLLLTNCSECGHSLITGMSWADTGESIPVFRTRVANGILPLLPSIPLLASVFGGGAFTLVMIMFVMLYNDIKPSILQTIATLGMLAVACAVGGWLGAHRFRSRFLLQRFITQHGVSVCNID